MNARIFLRALQFYSSLLHACLYATDEFLRQHRIHTVRRLDQISAQAEHHPTQPYRYTSTTLGPLERRPDPKS